MILSADGSCGWAPDADGLSFGCWVSLEPSTRCSCLLFMCAAPSFDRYHCLIVWFTREDYGNCQSSIPVARRTSRRAR